MIQTAIPLIVIFVMTVVGLELVLSDCARALRQSRSVAAALLAQAMIVPLVAGVLVNTFPMPPILAIGVLLASVAPIGTITPYYALLAGADVVLAVTLTIASSVLTAVTAPLLAAAAFRLFLTGAANIDVPIGHLLQRSIATLLLPIIIGATIRHFAPNWVTRCRGLLQRLSMLAVAALVAFILIEQVAGLSLRVVALATAMSLTFTLLLLGAGWLVGVAAAAQVRERRALLFGFPARNQGFAILLAVETAGDLAYASFAAVFFVAQVALLLPLATMLRRR